MFNDPELSLLDYRAVLSPVFLIISDFFVATFGSVRHDIRVCCLCGSVHRDTRVHLFKHFSSVFWQDPVVWDAVIKPYNFVDFKSISTDFQC